MPNTTKRRAGCFIFVFALLAGGGWLWWTHRGSGDSAPPGQHGMGRRGAMMGGPIPVSVDEVKQEDFEDWVSLAGTIAPLNVVTIRSRVDGQLGKVLFTEGQMVKAGDLIAEIDPRPFQVALDQANGALSRDQALQENARADLARYDALLKQNSIAKQQVDTQASLVQQYDAAMTSDRAAIASAELQLSYTKITSPISGRAGFRQIDAGNMIHSTDANGLVIVTQMDPMVLIFGLFGKSSGKRSEGLRG